MTNLNENMDATVAAVSTQQTSGSTTPAYAPVVPPTVTGHGERPEKFSGLDFKRLLRCSEAEQDPMTMATVQAWKHSDFLCKIYILNGLDKTLYNVYSPLPTAKLLWDSLDKKYKVEDAGAKKFLIGGFLDFKMVDSKKVMAQVQYFQLILHELATEVMALVEEFQVGVIIEKLPPSWRDFKNYLKHKRKGMSLDDLIVRLRIEENNRLNDRKGDYHMESKANVVEHSHKSGNQNKKRKLSGPRAEFWGPGHRANDCKSRAPQRKFKKKQPARAHLTEVEQVTDDILDLDLCAVVSEINLVGSNPRQWWVDTGATRHVCCDRELFSSFKETSNGEQLYMENSSSSRSWVKGRSY
ncbi:uncharacterized protein LOC130777071 [Actinidia eriantha]|uniref:uncharacterized protein LOC130777071 n=1 Tax=Actinidia eriantha TaxID=165200 RepID=UPI00258E2DEA|nr:uncharacterized protein LOC130777071 [Actinidia eriantha]